MQEPHAHNVRTPRLIRGIRWLRLILHISSGLLIAWAIFPWVGAGTRESITRHWSMGMLNVLNIRVNVVGHRPIERRRNLVLLSNHVSWLDIFVINATHTAHFVAKSEIRDWPIIGWLCERAGTIFIRRNERRDTARINQEMHETLEKGATVGLFPEGTTTMGDRLLKFHSSLLEPAVANKAWLVPTAIKYRHPDGRRCEEAAYAGDISFAESLRQIVGCPIIQTDITFAAPISAEGRTRRELALQAEQCVATLLDVAQPHMHQRFGASNVAAAQGAPR